MLKKAKTAPKRRRFSRHLPKQKVHSVSVHNLVDPRLLRVYGGQAQQHWTSPDGSHLAVVIGVAHWIEQPLDGKWRGWTVASRVLRDPSGRPVVAELRIFPTDKPEGHWPGEWRASADCDKAAAPERGIPKSLLRAGVPLGHHQQVANALGELPSKVRPAGYVLAAGSGGIRVSGSPVTFTYRRKRGRPARWTRQDYARFALAYDDAARQGQSPLEAVARAAGTNDTNAHNLVAKARQLGFLHRVLPGYRPDPLSPERRQEVEALAGGQTSSLQKERAHDSKTRKR